MRPGHFRRLLTAIAPTEEVFLRTGFRIGNGNKRKHLEGIARAVLLGFHEATAHYGPHDLRGLRAVSAEEAGFAQAGAAMGLAVVDAYLPQTPTRVQQLIDAARDPFMIHFGVGWAAARVNRRRREAAFLSSGNGVFRPVPLVGYGAHQVYFHWNHYVENRRIDGWLSPLARHAFDEGVGCALWLGEGADAERVASRIAEFELERQVDLWAGVGFICTYAGNTGRPSLAYLREASGPFWTYLAEGAATGARSRYLAGATTSDTELACLHFCGMNAGACTKLTEDALRGLSATTTAFDEWRNRIRSRF